MVPLEKKTVRYIDNFSVGTRGAASAEHFLQHRYAVIFLHRKGSLRPFERQLNQLNVLDLVDFADEKQETLRVVSKYAAKFNKLLRSYKKIKENNMLLHVEFTALLDYFELLEHSCKSIACLKTRALVYLAAAVSDFYLPQDEMCTHKIQSSQAGLELKLKPVPKLLGKLRLEWCPAAFIISFKLETDPELLNKKCADALDKYKHDAVVGNILEERRNKIIVMQSDGSFGSLNLNLTDASSEDDQIEIESQLVEFLVRLHDERVIYEG
jgi:phosphopantothenate---cysteine ligase (ATP)